MPELADVVRLHGPSYLKKYGEHMLPSHRRALEDILACRTPAMGGHAFECDCCGLVRHAWHSCKNRSCPKCHTQDTAKWIEKRRDELLNVAYYHVVFTIPAQLHPIARSNQSVFYNALMYAGAQALMKLCADPRYLGGTIGVMAILHTWTRTLTFHPHVHCLVPAGSISDGYWVSSRRRRFLVPIEPLSQLMRGILLDRLHKKLPDAIIPPQACRLKWGVYIRPAVKGSENVLQYLGRYVHRIAIANTRILAVDQHEVTFRYQDSSDHKWKTLTLSGEEFLRRYLQHVLPKRFHKVRYFGLWAPANRHHLRQVQLLLPERHTCPEPPKQAQASDVEAKCPRCLKGTMRFVAVLTREDCSVRLRAPP